MRPQARAQGDPALQASLQAALDDVLKDRRDGLKVLDAGCGSRLPISFGPHPYVVGIDISQQQLDRNESVDEKILGDIQTYPLPTDLDAVVCWDVLEHLPEPDRALRNFFRAVKPGGVIVVKSPNTRSLKALVTKLTPLRFHTWYYRRLLRRDWKGQDDTGPFPVYLRPSMRPDRVQRLAVESGMVVVHARLFENPQQRWLRRRFHVVGMPWTALKALVRVLSLGAISAERTDYFIILQKPAG